MEAKLIKIDRNGTKYFHDWTCPRCGGAGRSDNWWRTGYTCHECGGTGKRRKPKLVKEYTPEYAAKLDARRAAKQAAVEIDEGDLRRRADEAKRNAYKRAGFAADGTSYVYQGDTYQHRAAFRKAGAQWAYRRWFSPVPVDCGIEPIVVNADGCYDSGYYFDQWLVIEAYSLPKL